VRLIFLFALLFISLQIFAQDEVIWEFSVKDDVFIAEASIAEGWHLYSQHINNELGPIPTSFRFEEEEGLKLIGKTSEPESLKEYDENFEGELNFFKEHVSFTQKLKVSAETSIRGGVTYMICNATMCLPPTEELFTISINQ
jgi:thiol:disulfide interchange protein DsbD